MWWQDSGASQCDGEAKIQENETELKKAENETKLKIAENETELRTFKGKCYKCNEVGHKAHQCPEKKKIKWKKIWWKLQQL